jgi:peptide/nickel transport system permease protein
MLRFVLRRLALMVPVLVGLSILLFLWVRWLPGDPARALLGERATPENIARVNEAYGFN